MSVLKLNIVLLLASIVSVFASDLEQAAEQNDIADAILAQRHLPKNYASEFLTEFNAPEQSLIWKNYILQKLDVLYLHPNAAEERKAILARLWKESRSPTPTFAGTSLMTLLRLHEQKPEIVPTNKLIKYSQWVTDRTAYSNSDRLSALHVLAAIDQSKAAETARVWLANNDTAPMLQQTALNVLGKDATPADRQFIETFSNHPDLRLRTAAKTALSIE